MQEFRLIVFATVFSCGNVHRYCVRLASSLSSLNHDRSVFPHCVHIIECVRFSHTHTVPILAHRRVCVCIASADTATYRDAPLLENKPFRPLGTSCYVEALWQNNLAHSAAPDRRTRIYPAFNEVRKGAAHVFHTRVDDRHSCSLILRHFLAD